ncbi:MAG TPA: aspartate ammonia-lyase [Patescibacteria group bacterium]|nr:aspartate ammonia-lyase [Patescibacteria group bacterium]
MEYRREKDFLGEKDICRDAYWGIHTHRAAENFTLSSYRLDPVFIKALATVKKAACLANLELGYMEQAKAGAIIQAADEVIDGSLAGQFPVDALQGGAGTSTNMNVNEVLANRAIEILRGTKGDYSLVHPIEDVNLHQSTNDVYPTALKIACIFSLRDLSQEVAGLQGAFQKKEKEFARIVKIARTELKEAVPITLGAEFSVFAEAIGRDRWRAFKSEERLRVVNLGGTAVGTGLGAPRNYIFLVIEKLRELTGLGLSRGENVMDPTANSDPFVEVSGILKAHAQNLVKIANDLRLLSLLEEIRLPKLQAGSSIMPGKVNPVILEAVMQAGIKATANDAIITDCASRATLQINEFIPLLAFAILESLHLLKAADAMFGKHVQGIEADPEKCRYYFERSPAIVTAFIPRIGYDKASRLLKEFEGSGKSNLREFLKDALGEEMVDNVLSPYNLVSLGYKDEKNA